MTSRFREPNSAKYVMRGRPPPHPTELSCPSTKQATLSTAIVSNSELPTSSPETSVLAKSKSANDDTSPTDCHGVCVAPRAALNHDSDLTMGHETRGHLSWFYAVLSRLRIHSLRMSSVGACKHRGVLRRPGDRRRAAPPNVGHKGAWGRFQ